ncbi:MAG: radical SAM protein [Oscillospiraceae bacterium]|jgi:formate C-acetyltransferase|nr:radical SAM protein [Oscillospiraceae bacterium]
MSTASIPAARHLQAKNPAEQTLRVAKIQRTCVHDGPGLRTTVFFKGCGLRCLWCQNPENLSAAPLEGDVFVSTEEIASVLRKDAAYYRATGGGVTLSGGEPLLQNPAELTRLLTALKKDGIPVSVETTLFVPWDHIEPLVPFIDLFLVDFKVIGNSGTHKALTGQDDHLIQENFLQLLALEPQPKVRCRMVMVPGQNDSPAQIKAAADYLKSLDVTQLELLQYHTLHEDKAKRLGLDIPQLGISPAQGLVSLKAGAERFRAEGIDIFSDALQPKPQPAQFTKRVLRIQQEIRENPREISFETSLLKTNYYKKYNGFAKPVHIHRAERLHYVLDRRSLNVYPGELIVGNFTEKRVGGQIWEEQYGPLYISFLYKADRMTPVPFISTAEERKQFYTKIFPYWLPRCIIGRFTSLDGPAQLVQSLSSVAEQRVGFNNNFAGIAHFIVNFERMLTLGTTGLKAEVRQTAKEHPEHNRDLYRGMLIALDALESFAARYAALIQKQCNIATDPNRKAELALMAEVCRRVPKYPARTFHEALQSMMFLQIALCTEGYENAVSYGRVDQILQPYYEKDLADGRITYDQAKELLSLWVLKMDECILINDGDGLLNVSKLFETLSTDQALTFGGTKPDGGDATNDLTFMFIDICELLPLSVNMCARIHKDSPQPYLDRLAEIYINGCPMPELFADDVYFDTLQSHYGASPENARNYSIVGCVEPIASPDHFGNTDSANMNVTLPLLQAMKGQRDDLWNFDVPTQIEKFATRTIEYFTQGKEPLGQKIRQMRKTQLRRRGEARGQFVYDPPKDMDQLLDRFQKRLNFLARSILADQQKIEKVLSQHFTTPLASSLYPSCVRRGLDAYEGGADYNSAGIQGVGITDAADSLLAIDELVFRQRKYTLLDMIYAADDNFEGERNQQILNDILALPKFGDDRGTDSVRWVTKVMEIFNIALAQCPFTVRAGGTDPQHAKGRYAAGYYALNTSDRYGKYTQALPSGRKAGIPLANSVTPRYSAEQDDLLSALNDISQINFRDYAVNGSTVTFTVDAALFPGKTGVHNLGSIFQTFLTSGGMQFQPNVVSRELLLDAYEHPEKHKYLMVRVAGYCSYFNELSDDLKKVIINRTCYA